MVLLIIIPFFNGYFIGNIPYFQTNPYDEQNLDPSPIICSSPHCFMTTAIRAMRSAACWPWFAAEKWLGVYASVMKKPSPYLRYTGHMSPWGNIKWTLYYHILPFYTILKYLITHYIRTMFLTHFKSSCDSHVKMLKRSSHSQAIANTRRRCVQAPPANIQHPTGELITMLCGRNQVL